MSAIDTTDLYIWWAQPEELRAAGYPPNAPIVHAEDPSVRLQPGDVLTRLAPIGEVPEWTSQYWEVRRQVGADLWSVQAGTTETWADRILVALDLAAESTCGAVRLAALQLAEAAGGDDVHSAPDWTCGLTRTVTVRLVDNLDVLLGEEVVDREVRARQRRTNWAYLEVAIDDHHAEVLARLRGEPGPSAAIGPSEWTRDLWRSVVTTLAYSTACPEAHRRPRLVTGSPLGGTPHLSGITAEEADAWVAVGGALDEASEASDLWRYSEDDVADWLAGEGTDPPVPHAPPIPVAVAESAA